MKIAIIVGSVRINRQSVKVAEYLKKRLSENTNLDLHYLDLAEYGFHVMDERLRLLDNPDPGLKKFSQILHESDGILIVSPEYNGSYPGALKNALDYFKAEYLGKVFSIATVSDGKWGGINASHHLESLVVHLKGYLSPYKLMVPFVDKLSDPIGEVTSEDFVRQTEKFILEFLWLCEAIAAKRIKEEHR